MKVHTRFDLVRGVAVYTGVATSIAITLPHWLDQLGIDFRFSILAVLLPPLGLAVLGLASNPDLRGRLRYPGTLLMLVGWMVASLWWTDGTERGRGMIIAAQLLTPLPIAFLFTESSQRRRLVEGFLLGSLFTSGTVFWVHYGMGQGFILGDGDWFNRNDVACNLVFCVVLCFYLRDRETTWMQPFTGPLILFHSATVIMTASRGASIALLAILLLRALLVVFKRGVVVLAVPLALALLVWFDVGQLQLAQRFSADADVQSLGGRTEIWTEAAFATSQEPMLLLHGTGLGGAEKLLGRRWSDLEGARVGTRGISRKAPHNSVLELSLTTGAPGALLLLWLSVLTFHFGRENDRRLGGAHGRTLLTFFFIFAFVTTIWRQSFWAAAFIMLCELLNRAPADQGVSRAPVRRNEGALPQAQPQS